MIDLALVKNMFTYQYQNSPSRLSTVTPECVDELRECFGNFLSVTTEYLRSAEQDWNLISIITHETKQITLYPISRILYYSLSELLSENNANVIW